jgi:hypothetical protein
MGEIATPADPASLAAAIVSVLQHRERYVKAHDVIAGIFDSSRTADFYEDLFARLAGVPEKAEARV